MLRMAIRGLDTGLFSNANVREILPRPSAHADVKCPLDGVYENFEGAVRIGPKPPVARSGVLTRFANTGEFISTTSKSIAVDALCKSIFNHTHTARCAPPIRARGLIRCRGFANFDILLNIFEFS